MHGLTPLKNVHFLVLVKTSIFWSYNVCFLSRISKNEFLWHNFFKKHPYEKFRILNKIHGVTPLENVHFLARFKTFFFLKIILFFLQYQKRSFLIWFLWKTPIRKSSIFWQNPWTNPLTNVHFFALLKTSIFWS